MKDIDKIVTLTQEYLNAHNRMNERSLKWNDNKFDLVKNTLDKICAEITDKNDFFKSNLYVNSDENNVVLRAGQIMVPLEANNSSEKGFEISFLKISNGKIYAYFKNHTINSSDNGTQLYLFDNLDDITENKIIELVYDGIEKAMKSSFLFIGDK